MPETINLQFLRAQRVRQAKVGVVQYRLGDGKVGWFKHASRPLNNTEKVRAMGVITRPGPATEAQAFLPEREVLASQVAAQLVPHLAVAARLAKLGVHRGVFIDHAEGDMASGHIDFETLQLAGDILSAIKVQLADLQAFDYLIGSVDRHVENYMISQERAGRYVVRAIDNDLSFPAVGVADLGRDHVPQSKFEGLPAGYTVVVAERIAGLSEDDLTRMIQDTLAGAPNLDAVVRQAASRLRDLKADVRAKSGRAAAPRTPSNYTGLVFA
jgi:hypothetical protein